MVEACYEAYLSFMPEKGSNLSLLREHMNNMKRCSTCCRGWICTPTSIDTFPSVAFYEGVLKNATTREALRDDLSVDIACMTLMRNLFSLTDVLGFPPYPKFFLVMVSAHLLTWLTYF